MISITENGNVRYENQTDVDRELLANEKSPKYYYDETVRLAGAAEDAQEAAEEAAEAAMTSTPEGYADFVDNLAPTYSSSATYSAGDYVLHESILYKANADISTAEDWTAAHWTEVRTMTEVTDLKEDLNHIGTAQYPIALKVTGGSYTCEADGINRYTIGSVELTAGHTYLVRISGKYDYGSSTQCTLNFARKGTSQGVTLYVSIADLVWTKPTSGAFEYNYHYTPSGSTSYDFGIRFMNATNNSGQAAVSDVILTVFDITDTDYTDSADMNRIIDESTEYVCYPAINPFNYSIIDCFGDSQTAGTGGTPYTTALQTLLGDEYAVNNYGVGGEYTTSILARMGAIPCYVEPFTMAAANNNATVTLHTLFGYDWINIRNGRGMNPVNIDGVDGQIFLSSDYATTYFEILTTESGNQKTVSRPVVVRPNALYRTPYHTLILMMGQNGGWSGANSEEMLVQQYQAAVEYMKSEKYLFIGLTTGTADSRSALEIAMSSAFGGHYINARDYLVNYGLDDNDLTATADDTTAIAEGSVPPSLLYDSTHLNTYGYASLANCIYQRGKDLGYWS